MKSLSDIKIGEIYLYVADKDPLVIYNERSNCGLCLVLVEQVIEGIVFAKDLTGDYTGRSYNYVHISLELAANLTPFERIMYRVP